MHGDFGALARFTGDGFDLHIAAGDFGGFVCSRRATSCGSVREAMTFMSRRRGSRPRSVGGALTSSTSTLSGCPIS